MTIYGEYRDEFRPRPKKWLLLLFSLFSILACLELATLFSSTVHVLVMRSSTADGAIPIYAPVAQPPYVFVAGPKAALLRETIAPFVDLITAALVLILIPTSTRLSSRLFIHHLALALMLIGLSRAFEVSPTDWLEGNLSATGLWRPTILLLALGLIHFIERRRTQLLANLFSTETPGERVALWTVIVPVPMLMIFGAALWGDYGGEAFAAIVVLAWSFFVQLTSRSLPRYEQLDDVLMRESTATVTFAAAAILSAAITVFGFPPAGEPRALLLGGNSAATLVPTNDITIRTAEAKARDARRKGAPPDDKKSVIDIRWSKKK